MYILIVYKNVSGCGVFPVPHIPPECTGAKYFARKHEWIQRTELTRIEFFGGIQPFGLSLRGPFLYVDPSTWSHDHIQDMPFLRSRKWTRQLGVTNAYHT